MKNVVYLGSKEIGFRCLKFLFESRKKLSINILGVLTNKKGKRIHKFCTDNKISIIQNLSTYLSIEEEVNIAISVQYHKILKKIHIDKAKEITINLHMAPLPEYRGCNQFSYAIINNDKEFGTTIHKLEESIDGGAIIFEERFKIPQDCWVKELYDITFYKSINLFKNNIHKIIEGNYKLIPQSKLIPERGTSLHYRKDIENLKHINLEWPKDKIERYIRATYMPGFEPPYIIIGAKKFYFNKKE